MREQHRDAAKHDFEDARRRTMSMYRNYTIVVNAETLTSGRATAVALIVALGFSPQG